MKSQYPDAPGDTLEEGRIFQDFVVSHLARLGLQIEQFASRSAQYKFGESVFNYEIKLDSRCFETGRLSIEVAEKTAKDREWVPSGIFTPDQSVYYVQGNMAGFFVFAKKHLQLFYEKYRPAVTEKGGTIKTFYMALASASKMAIHEVHQGQVDPSAVARELCLTMNETQLDILIAEVAKRRGKDNGRSTL